MCRWSDGPNDEAPHTAMTSASPVQRASVSRSGSPPPAWVSRWFPPAAAMRPGRVSGWLHPGQNLSHHGPGTTSGHGGQRCRESGAQRLRERDIDRAQDVRNVARDAAGLFPGQVGRSIRTPSALVGPPIVVAVTLSVPSAQDGQPGHTAAGAIVSTVFTICVNSSSQKCYRRTDAALPRGPPGYSRPRSGPSR